MSSFSSGGQDVWVWLHMIPIARCSLPVRLYIIPWWGPSAISSNFATGHATIPCWSQEAKTKEIEFIDCYRSLNMGLHLP